jgi:hypothetical protein
MSVAGLPGTSYQGTLPTAMPSGTKNGANGVSGRSGSALCGVNEFVNQEYDYIVVGGGTAGCVIAARLTENPNVKVGVLEAGSNRMDDPQISTPSLYPTLIGRENYDWCFQSIPVVRFDPVSTIVRDQAHVSLALSRQQDLLHASRQSPGR